MITREANTPAPLRSVDSRSILNCGAVINGFQDQTFLQQSAQMQIAPLGQTTQEGLGFLELEPSGLHGSRAKGTTARRMKFDIL
jgi:hypothetical protein